MKRFLTYLLTAAFFAGLTATFQSCIYGREAPKSYGEESKTYKSQKKELQKRRANRKVKRQNRESRYISPVE